MAFNNSKFEQIRYGNAELVQQTSYKTSDGNTIQVKEHVRDVGVTMYNDLSFSHHIKNIVAKGKQMSGWILRTFSSQRKEVLITLFKSMVIHTLEYCSPLWSPCDKHYINLIERVQREFTKRISDFSTYQAELRYNVCYPSYQTRLDTLKIFSLEHRRDRYAIIYIFKIIHGYVPNPGFVWDYNTRTKIHIRPFQVSNAAPPWIRKLRRNSLFHRGSLTFNLLPVNLREINSHNIPERKHLK